MFLEGVSVKRKKLRILATTSYASGAGQLTEIAQTGQRLQTFCLSCNVFDTIPEEELIRFKNHVLTSGIDAIILDNCWLPQKSIGVTIKQIDFAKEMHSRKIKVFFLCRSDENLTCEVWQAFKPLSYPDMNHPADSLVRISPFLGSEVFDMKTGQVFPKGNGDSGLRQVQDAIREYRAFHERDWPKIVAAVQKELAL